MLVGAVTTTHMVDLRERLRRFFELLLGLANPVNHLSGLRQINSLRNAVLQNEGLVEVDQAYAPVAIITLVVFLRGF